MSDNHQIRSRPQPSPSTGMEHLIPHRPEWDDEFGYMTNAIPWIEKNMGMGQSLNGVRVRYCSTSERVKVDRFRFHVNHLSPAYIRLDMDDGRKITISNSEMFVYPDNFHTKRRDAEEVYREFYNDSEDRMFWQLVRQTVRRDVENDPSFAPKMANMWVTSIAKIVDSTLQAFGREVYRTLGTWTLLYPRPLSEYTGIVTSHEQVRLSKEAVRVKDELGPNPDIGRIGELLELIWQSNQTLPGKWRYAPHDWYEALVKRAPDPETASPEAKVLHHYLTRYLNDFKDRYESVQIFTRKKIEKPNVK